MPAKNIFDLDVLLIQLGQVGKRLTEIGASEGAAGNLSVCVRGDLDVTARFPDMQVVELPLSAPELAGATIIVTGSGRRLREIVDSPTANLACVVVNEDGMTGRMFRSRDCEFKRVTSEFNSHLAIHHDRLKSSSARYNAVLHAQPVHLTYLSHIPAYQDERYFNTHLFRWQPETILSIPEGIGMIPFIVNGSDEQMSATVRSMQDHRVVMWARHGVVARSDDSLFQALDLVEYAETAAHYEYLNLSAGEKADGLSPEQIRQICEAWNVRQGIF
ncbi:MAG: rhamnulose-1-phosphate aldolase [Anaerolineales bacterium]|nr:rhamnulose-1-phosphate aldolase [Anaerolineae bacterium]PWB73926.1 MAG: rhamnulose-1-phosphate aldolase [Anaerolineales bacterium]